MIPPSCGMNPTKLEVRENEEEPELSDVDDDVFVRGRSNGFRLELYDNAKKPLMAPRKKHKDFDKLRNGGGNFHTEVRSSPPSLRILCIPICYILIATFAMLGVIALIAVLSHYISVPLSLLKFWKKLDNSRGQSSSRNSDGLLPCDTFKVEDVWIRKFPKLLTESAFRLLDVNKDGVDDIIFGFATGADGYEVPEIVCDIYFYGQKPCYGGILALNGRDGSELWRHWTSHEVFALNCNEDLTRDGVRDCLFSGRAGVFGALDGKDGHLLWDFGDSSPAKVPLMNIYTPQFIRDVNDDQMPDILAVHGGDPLASPGSKKRLAGRILILSGKDGEILQWMETPDKAESYYSPQILTRGDGADAVLLGTGGETHPGSLYVIPLHDITNGHTKNVAKARLIYQDNRKGVISTPVLTDITSDGIEDIIIPLFNSTVVAYDGRSFEQIWNFSFPSSETYTTPTPGYFNEDNVPDFLVKYQTGPGFPIYYEGQTTILDGRTGKSFLALPLKETIGSQASTPLIRVQGYGNDIFLYWTSNCLGVDTSNKSEFDFRKGTNVHEQSRANLCKLRFGSKLINQLHAFNRETGLPGALIYDSESRREAEYAGAVNTSLEGQTYLEEHPNLIWRTDTQSDTSANVENIPKEPEIGILPNGQDSAYTQISYGRKYSEAEVSANLPYQSAHSVRKHGGGRYIPRPPTALWPAYDDSFSNSVDLNRGQLSPGGLPQGQLPPPSDDEFGRVEVDDSGNDWERAKRQPVRKWHSNYQSNLKLDPQLLQRYLNQGQWNPDEPGQGHRIPDHLDQGQWYLDHLNQGHRNPGHLNLDHLTQGHWNPDHRNHGRWNPGQLNQGQLGQASANSFGLPEFRERLKRAVFSEPDAPNLGHQGQVSREGDDLRHSGEDEWARIKRHVGPHDGDGIQRLISTGTLVKPLWGEDGIDFVFATYWFYPAKTQLLLPKTKKCIEEKMMLEGRRFEESNTRSNSLVHFTPVHTYQQSYGMAEESMNLDVFLNWTSRMTPALNGEGPRVGVVKALLCQMTLPELKKINSILSHSISHHRSQVKKKVKGRALTTPAPAVTIQALPETPLAAPESSITTFPTPYEFKRMIHEKDWWKKFNKSDFVGFDAEFVQLKRFVDPSDVHRAKICAIYQDPSNYTVETVSWNPGEVIINKYTIPINGITYANVKEGNSFMLIRDNMAKKLANKIVVTVGGRKDFQALELDEQDYLHLDLQHYYTRTDPNNFLMRSVMSLRDMYYYHFRKDCQRGKHSSLRDAKNTLQVLLDGFMNLDYFDNADTILEDFEDLPNLNTNEKLGKFWCANSKEFGRLCQCCEN